MLPVSVTQVEFNRVPFASDGLKLPKGLKRLAMIRCTSNRAVSMTLIEADSLQALDVSQSDIPNLGFAAKATNLKYLKAHNCNQLKTLEGVTALIRLESLDISGTRIRTVDDLTRTSIRALDIAGTPIEDLRDLRRISSLRSVTVSENVRTRVLEIVPSTVKVHAATQ